MLRLGHPYAQHRRMARAVLLHGGRGPFLDVRAEMLKNVDWSKFGVEPGTGKARDPRCDNCMTQCGFEPSGALSNRLDDSWKNFTYNFRPRLKPTGKGSQVNAYNGVTTGRGHLTGEQVKKTTPATAPVLQEIGGGVRSPSLPPAWKKAWPRSGAGVYP